KAFVVGDELALHVADAHLHARAWQRIAVDALVGVDQVAPERVRLRRGRDAARLDDAAVHEHARRGAVPAIRRDLVRPVVVADADRLAGALDLGPQVAGEAGE